MLLGIIFLAFTQFWRRSIIPSVYHLHFAIFAPLPRKYANYYDCWKFYYEHPGLRKHWKKRHNNFSRLAYKRLVREARREDKEMWGI